MQEYSISEEKIEEMFEKEFEETEFIADRVRKESYDRFARGVDCCLAHINKKYKEHTNW
jgi:hypothetical protein